jgi:hypothetical protein
MNLIKYFSFYSVDDFIFIHILALIAFVVSSQSSKLTATYSLKTINFKNLMGWLYLKKINLFINNIIIKQINLIHVMKFIKPTNIYPDLQ